MSQTLLRLRQTFSLFRQPVNYRNKIALRLLRFPAVDNKLHTQILYFICSFPNANHQVYSEAENKTSLCNTRSHRTLYFSLRLSYQSLLQCKVKNELVINSQIVIILRKVVRNKFILYSGIYIDILLIT